MNHEYEVILLHKQIEVFEKMIDYLEKSKEVIKKFDNKIANIKLDRVLKEIGDEIRFNSDKIYVFINDKSISTKSNGRDCYDIYFVGIYATAVLIKIENKRIEVTASRDNINLKIDYLKSEIEDIKRGLSQFDDMLKDYQKINNDIELYKDKYSHWIRDSHNKFY